MAEASLEQVQAWANERTRPLAQMIRALRIRSTDDAAAFGSVYERINGSGGWTDQRNDAPPNLLTQNDVGAIHTTAFNLALLLNGGPFANDAAKVACVNEIVGQLPIVTKACVQAP